MKKIAIIGTGRIFAKHFESIKLLKKKFNLVGVFDKNPIRNKRSVKLSKLQEFNNYNDLLRHTNPDIVSILIESGNHLRLCKELIIKHNIKNFIIEKPLDTSTKKILNFKNFIKGKKINIFTVKQNRFNKAVLKTKDLIDKKFLGKIFMISACCKWRRDQKYYDLDDWRGKRNLDGGVLMNQAIHHIDLLIHLVGDVESVVGYGDTRFVKLQSENIAVANLRFKNGCLGTIEATTATAPSDYEGSITIMGSEGTIKIGGFASNEVVYFSNFRKTKLNKKKYYTNIHNIYGKGHLKFYEYVELFLDRKIKKNKFDIENAIKSVKVVEKIIKSFKSKKIENI